MPITQDRMIDLLKELEATIAAGQALRDSIAKALRLGLEHALTQEEVLHSVVMAVNAWHPPPLAAYHVERAHFLRHEVRNEKKKRYLAGQRRMAGIAPRNVEVGRVAEAPPQLVTLPPEYVEQLRRMEENLAKQRDDDGTPPDFSTGIFGAKP